MGLFKRKNSPYYFMKFQLNGRRIYESTKTANKKFAEQIYLDRRNEILTGRVPAAKLEPKQIITFRKLTESYIGFIKNRLRSAKNIEYMVNKLLFIFNDKPLNDFTLTDIEGIQNDLLVRGLSIRTANHYPRVLKTMFRKAVDWELVDESVVKKLARCKNLKGENKRLRYLSEEEAERLILNCEPYLRSIVITALNTGMRKSEIFGLTWDRVDLKNRIILLDRTKNGERRELPVNDTLYNMLSGLIRNIASDYVFYNPKSKTAACFNRLDRSFHTALKKAKIVDFHFHDLRHTFASWLAMKGVDLAAVQKLLGHKSIMMTMRYAHLAPGHIKKAVEVLDELSCKIVAVKENVKNSNT